MGLTAEQNQQLTALEPHGPALPKVPEANWAKLKLAFGDEFARIEQRALDLMREADPRSVYEMLEEWEVLADLPDCFTQADTTLDARRGALTERVTRTGGQSKQYFIDRALAIGHDITITETKVSQAGVLIAGDELSVTETDRFYWKVSTVVDNTYSFVAGAAVAGDELGFWAPIRLECLLDRLKPAHTEIIWEYLNP